MEKWHQHLYGRPDITVHTDHQPLETVLKKLLCKAPRRLQRMMLKLQRYQFSVRHKEGKELYVADTCLAHLSLIAHRMELAEMDIEPNRVTSETMQRIKQETA